MHDPDTLIFSFKGFCLWHHDPCRPSYDDDSCGWFLRSHHGDKKVLERIEADFAFSWDASYGGWFSELGDPLMSTPGIVLDMFRKAAWVAFGRSHRKTDAFLHRHIVDILTFAENTVDSMHESITGKYGVEKREERIKSAAAVVYGCILRWTRPWYKHPRWHVHHWRVTWPVSTAENSSGVSVSKEKERA